MPSGLRLTLTALRLVTFSYSDSSIVDLPDPPPPPPPGPDGTVLVTSSGAEIVTENSDRIILEVN